MKNFFQYQNLKGLANIWAEGIPNTRGRYRSPKWRELALPSATKYYQALSLIWLKKVSATKRYEVLLSAIS